VRALWRLRVLLWLYPAAYRRKYGDEIVETMRRRYEAAGGGVRRWLMLSSLVVDALWSGACVRVGGAGQFVRGLTKGWGLDVRFVMRAMRRHPGYALTTVGVLGIAVSAGATVFSYVRGTLLRTPPYRDPAGVVAVWGSNPVRGQLRDVISGRTFIDLQRDSKSISLAAYHYSSTYIQVGGRPEVIDAIEVSADFLDVLGVAPVLGRDFDDRDRTSGGPSNVMISHAYWRERLGGMPDVIGRALITEGTPKTIIGVLPGGFEFVAPATLYVPLRDDVLAASPRTNIQYNVLGRLRPGVSVRSASEELSRVMAEAHRRDQPGWVDWTVLVEPLQRVSVAAVRPILWTLAVTVALVLLVALVNLAMLFEARTLARADELGVRQALGAGRGRLARVLAIETGSLAAIGALLGLLVTPFLLEKVASLVPLWIAIPGSALRIPVLRASLDAWVLAISLGTAVAGALALTVPGALLSLRRSRLARSGRFHRGVRGIRMLVGIEIGAATVLCLAAGLTMRSAARLLSTDTGVRDRGLLTLYFGDAWSSDAAGQVAYFRRVIQAVEAVPGIRSASTIDYVDFQAEDDFAGLDLLDREQHAGLAVREEWRRVGPRLFETAGMKIVAGRDFLPADFDGAARTAVINQSFADKHYGGASAIGRVINIHNQPYRNLEIVGVVADVKSLGPAAAAPPMLYVPWQGSKRGTQGLYVRVDGDAVQYATAVRDAIWSVDPSQPVADIRAMSDLVEDWVAIPRVTRALVSVLGAVALLLAAVGVFGVIAFAVRTRRSEMGVRLALGATPDRLMLELLRAVAPVVAFGGAAGVLAGIGAAYGARAVLFDVSPLDPLVLGWAAAVMTATALLATWLPARRVRQIDAGEVMRTQ